jgi:hypothetical protein
MTEAADTGKLETLLMSRSLSDAELNRALGGEHVGTIIHSD